MKNWFNTLKLAVTKPSEYRKLSERTFWSGFGYLFLLVLIGVLIKTVMFSAAVFYAVPKVKSQLPQVKVQMLNAYPEELVVNIKNGEASTNVTEPYVISVQEVIPQLTEDEKTTLLVIDTNTSVDNYLKYKTLFLLTKNSLAYPNTNNSSVSSYEVFPLSEIKDAITIDKSLYDKVVEQVLPLVDKVPQFMYGFATFALLQFPIVGGFFVVVGSLFYLLIMNLLLLLVSKVMKRNFSYKTLFKASMYGLTVPLVVTYLAEFTNVKVPGLYNLVFLGWMICVLTLNRAPVYTKNNARSKKVSSR